MEDAMLRIRIVTIGAVFAFAVTGTAAQSAASGSPGKPLPLLQFVGHKTKPAPVAHTHRPAKIAKRATAKTRIVKRRVGNPHHVLAAAQHHPIPALAAEAPTPAPAQTASVAAPANVWPVADSGLPGAVIGGSNSFTPGTAAPAAVTTEKVVESDPDGIVTGAQSGAPLAPKAVSPVKLTAAGEAAKTAAPAAANPPPPVSRAMLVAPLARGSDPIGSASWIAQVLAALGGAIAAGAVAWFLIKPTPEQAA